MSETITHIEKKKALVPELRFREFDGEWKLLKLNKVCTKIMVGIASSATHAYRNSGIPLLRNQNIKEGGLDDSDMLYITKEYETQHRNKRLKKGDILTVRTGYPGLSCLVPDKYENAQCFTALIIRPNQEKIKSSWLVQYINSPIGKRKLFAFEAGGAQKNINSGSLENLIIPLITLPEQQKIAAFLSAVDQKIQLLTRKKELLEQYKKGVMQQLFSQQIRFKDADGKEFPEWETKRLSHFLSVSKRINNDIKYDKSDVLSVSGEYGIVNQIEFQGRSFAGESVHNYGVVETGDIVYTKSPLKSNPYGIIKVNKGKPGIVSTLYAVYTVKDNSIGEYFDYYFQLDDNTNSYLRPLVHKGAKNDMKISAARVLIDPITVPCKKEQIKICQYLNALDLKIQETRKQLTQTQSFKKGLLQKMFV